MNSQEFSSLAGVPIERSPVLVIGSANMDLVVRTRQFPKAGETVMGEDFQTFPGGKGANQATAVGKLGGKVKFAGRIGADSFGSQLLQSLQVSGVDTGHTVMDPNGPTGVALIQVDQSGQNTIVVVPGANSQIDPSEIPALLEETAPKIVLLQLEIPIDVVSSVARNLRDDTILILNPAPACEVPLDLLARVDYLTPNETETEFLTGIRPKDEASCSAAASKLFSMGVRRVLITLGELGSYLATPESGRMFSTLSVDPVDSTAAGDAFNGAFAMFLSEGFPEDRAVLLANAVGAISTQRAGAQASMPTRREVRAVIGDLL